jgi:hypothetical protein
MGLMLAELPFPAKVWQLVAHAQSWGVAPADCVEQLTELPPGIYRAARDVLRAPGLDAQPARAQESGSGPATALGGHRHRAGGQ